MIKNSFNLFTFFTLLLMSLPSTQAAPCCAGSSAIPALMTGDEKALLQLSASDSSVVADAPVNGLPVYRTQNIDESTRAFRLSGSNLISDRLQVGASLPLLNHSTQKNNTRASNTEFGDFSMTTAYEILPEWDYSAWKPKGYLFSQFTFPTGRSIYESHAPFATDVSGQGFYSLSIGSALIKRLSDWDFNFVPGVTHSFYRRFSGGMNVYPGWSARTYLGIGYNYKAFRAGFFIQPDYQQTRKIEDVTANTTTKSSPVLRWDSGLEMSYLFQDTWGATATYTDQTWFGPAHNTTLARSVSLMLTHRWFR